VLTNPFFLIILIAVVLEFVLGLVANLLNLRALKLELPTDLEDVYNPDEYHKSQQYTRTNTRFEFVSDTFGLVVILSFWFSGGFNYLDQVIRSWGFIPIVNGLLYLGVLLAAYSLLMLPFSVYATFVIEERFGFNRTTLRTFVLDRFKGVGLVLLLGAPLLAGVLALFQYAHPHAWLYCWIAVTMFSLTVQFVAPTWIMPLFNKFTSMEPSELKDAILNYSRSVKFPVRNVLVVDGSRRSTKSNAFFTGFGHNKRIALFDTLIKKHSTPELVAILGHEIGHYKKKHILQGIIIGTLHTGIMLFLLSIFLDSPGLYHAFYMEQQSVYAGLLFFGLLYTPVEMLLSIALRMLSRRNEYQADRFAAETIEESENLVSALKKLSADNLSNLTPHPFYVLLNYSHPPLLRRIRAIQALSWE
jgi:STE24 endopeptidase